jgi:hypothetical protein
MASDFRKQIEQLQLRLFDEVLHEVSELEAIHSAKLSNPRNDYLRTTSRPLRNCRLVDILNSCSNNRLCLVGDFHTFRQSQRGYLRLLRSFSHRKSPRSLIIALECFLAEHQRYIDQYLECAISESEFLKSVRYDQTWGFPWENYRDILEFARERGIKVVGINSQTKKTNSFAARDQAAAKLLCELSESHPNRHIFCLIGEYHLADNALMSHLREINESLAKSTVRIFSNIDDVFFRRQRAISTSQTIYLSFDSKTFCKINASPWSKWMSALIWEEESLTHRFNHHDGEESFEFDWDHFFLKILKDTSHVFMLPHSDILADHFRLINAKSFLSSEDVSPESKEAWMGLSETMGAYYDQESGYVVLKTKSSNSIVSAASNYLFQKIWQQSGINHRAPGFEIMASSFRTLVAKAFNPKRKIAGYAAFSRSLAHERKSRSPSTPHELKSMLQIAEVYQLLQSPDLQTDQQAAIKALNLESQSQLGSIIGTDLFHQLLQKSKLELSNVIEQMFSVDIRDGGIIHWPIDQLLAMSRPNSSLDSKDDATGAA